MRRLRRSIRVGAALTLFVLGAPVDGAAADTHVQEEASEQGFGDEPSANPGLQRSAGAAAAVESTGPPARSAARGLVNCGEVITKNTTLLRDVGPCPGNGIIIGADNIILNLNGHTISGTPGPGDGNAAGIRLPFRTGVRITGQPGNSGRTGTVTGFDAGVFVNGGSGNTIENLVLSDNISQGGDALLGDGIVLFHSANNRILDNLVSHNGPFDGIGVLGLDSNYNLIQGNTVELTPATPGAFVADGSGVGILINNFLDEFMSPRRGEPIRNNDVIDNVVRLNDNSGISNITNIDSRIIGNTVEDNGQRGERCILFPAPTPCEALVPVADASNGIGFTYGEQAPAVTRALIENNVVTGNTGNGIYITTRENRIVGNTAVGNGASGAGVVPSRGGPQPRFDLHDATTTDTLCEAFGAACPPPQRNCDQNVWHQNVFETAFPDCARGTGPEPAPLPPPHPSCSDGLDNDGDGFIDGEDRNCGGEGQRELELERPDLIEPTPIDEGPTPIDEGPTPIEPTPIEPTPIEPTPIEPTPIEPTPIQP